VYIADTDGDVTVFKVSKEKEQVAEQNMDTPTNTTPVVANGVLYIATMRTLFAIEEGAGAKPAAAGSSGK
jgi:hypothetical protein